MLHANFMALCFIEPQSLLIEVLHCRNTDFLPFMLLWPWPWPDDLHIRTWPVLPGCANMNVLHQDFRKLASDKQTRLTDTTEIIYHTASRGGESTIFCWNWVFIVRWSATAKSLSKLMNQVLLPTSVDTSYSTGRQHSTAHVRVLHRQSAAPRRQRSSQSGLAGSANLARCRASPDSR